MSIAKSHPPVQICLPRLRGLVPAAAMMLTLAMIGARSAWAIDPPDSTPMAVAQQSAQLGAGPIYNSQQIPWMANGENTEPQAYIPYLRGCYVIREVGFQNEGPNQDKWATWAVLPGAPPGAADPQCVGQAQVANLSCNGQGGQWAVLRGVAPGWVTVTCKSPYPPYPTTVAYYRFYDVVIMEDDVGGKAGFDPRYGGTTPYWFPERGGYHFMNGGPGGLGELYPEPSSEHLFGYNDRYPSGGTSEWTASGSPALLSHITRWRPEAMLASAQGPTFPHNSLLAVPRDNQYVRIWIRGPREPLPRIPIALYCVSAVNGGEVEPGKQPPWQDWDILCGPNGPQDWFMPPSLSPALPGLGDWTGWWPLSVSHVVAPEVRVKIEAPWQQSPLSIDDPPDEMRKRNWIVRVPWKGAVRSGENGPVRKLSAGYGDIEVEAKILPHGYPQGLAWHRGGLDARGLHEGAVQQRFCTVIELQKIRLRTSVPPEDKEYLLKEEWARRLKSWTRNVPIPPDRITLGLGALVLEGGEGRAADPAELELWLDYTSGVGAARPLVASYLEEVTLTAANRAIETIEPIVWPGSYLIRAEKPTDVREPWADITPNGDRPQSMLLGVRGYIGELPQNPGVGDYAEERPEFEDNQQETQCERTTRVHFINALADLNNDGLYDAEDDDPVLEELGEFSDDEFGMIVNTRIEGLGAGVSDGNQRKILVMLTRPTASATYAPGVGQAGYEVWLRCPGCGSAPRPGMYVYAKADRSEAWTYDGEARAWVMSVPESGMTGAGESADFVTAHIVIDQSSLAPPSLGVAMYMQLFLVCKEIRESEGTGPVETKRVEQALDEIPVTLGSSGLDMDSNNDGFVVAGDDSPIELDWPGVAVVIASQGDTAEQAQAGYDLKIYEHPFWSGLLEPTAKLVKEEIEGGGTYEILDESGAVVAGVAAQEYELPEGALLDCTYLLYSVRGVTPGRFSLKLQFHGQHGVLAEDVVRGTIVELGLQEVSYGSSAGECYSVVSDIDPEGNVYDPPHWRDNSSPPDNDADDVGDRRMPVCFLKGATPMLSAIVRVGGGSGAPSGWATGIYPMARAGGDLTISETAGTTTSGGHIEFENVEAAEELPEAVRHFPEFTLAWQVSLDGGRHWWNVAETRNEVFCVLLAPSPSENAPRHLMHSLLRVGCEAADCATTAAAAAQAVWAEFADVGSPVVNVRGLELGYWRGHRDKVWEGESPFNPPDVRFGVSGLLTSVNGTCQAWALFLHETFDAVGVRGSEFVVVTPREDSVPNANGLMARNWVFTHPQGVQASSPSGVVESDFQWLFDRPDDWDEWDGTPAIPGRATPADGIAGQDNDDPRSWWIGGHVVVRLDGHLYDPSYGLDFGSEEAYEDAMIGGFLHAVDWSPGDVSYSYIRMRPNRSGVPEVTFTRAAGEE